MNDLWVIFPECVLLILTCVVLIGDLYIPKKWQHLTYLLSQFALLATMVACWRLPNAETQVVFSGQFMADPIARMLKLMVLGLVFVVFVYSREYTQQRKMAFAEFHLLALFSTLGMMLLISANSMLMVYLGLELLSLPLYALVALQRDSQLSVEAGMKYFVMGALASGLLLYGISLFYGLSGSIQLPEIKEYLKTVSSEETIVGLFAMVFVIIGFAFKLGAVPFHMWIPDVYEGAPTNVTLLIASAPKVAAFAMVYRLLHDALPEFADHWSPILIILAVLSMAMGNLAAIVQTNVKRLLGYSTIAHVGFLFLALLVAPQIGYAPAMYYIVVYAIVTVCGFGVLLALSYVGFDAQNLDDLKGLAAQKPWLAFILLLVAFSLAGVPPTVGFYAKFMVLSALVNAGLTWLAVLAVVFSIIGAYYYLKIVRTMYFDKRDKPISTHNHFDLRMVLSLNGMVILGLGIFPAPLYMICQNVATSLLR